VRFSKIEKNIKNILNTIVKIFSNKAIKALQLIANAPAEFNQLSKHTSQVTPADRLSR
jgi:hypothetical protein